MATASKRTLIEPNPGDKRYVRRDAKGEFKESDDVGRSLASDVRKKAKTAAKPGQGDKGDRQAKPAAKKSATKTPAKKAAKTVKAAKKAPAKKAPAKKAPAKKAPAKKAPAKKAAKKASTGKTARKAVKK